LIFLLLKLILNFFKIFRTTSRIIYDILIDSVCLRYKETAKSTIGKYHAHTIETFTKAIPKISNLIEEEL